MAKVSVDISFLRGLDVVQGNGGVFVVIERRQKAGLYTDVQLLHLRSVEAEIVPAQRPDSDQFHLPLEYVDEHRQFVQPGFAKEFTPAVHPIVMRELSAILQAFMLKHIRL